MMPIAARINDVDMLRIRDEVLSARVLGGTPCDYPWDRWAAMALRAGVPEQLSNLGRTVFREAYQHQWDDDLQVECGWLDGGQRMIYQALAFPEACEARWSSLYASDGDMYAVPPVENDPMELAYALKAAGISINMLL